MMLMMMMMTLFNIWRPSTLSYLKPPVGLWTRAKLGVFSYTRPSRKQFCERDV